MAKKSTSRRGGRRAVAASPSSDAPARTSGRRTTASPGRTLFGRTNYAILIMSLLLIATGYIAMALDNQIKGFVPLYLSPTLLMAGYLLVIYAILHRDRPPASADASEA